MVDTHASEACAARLGGSSPLSGTMEQSEIDRLAKLIWGYHHMGHILKKADCIFVLGSMDTRVAEYAADLYLEGYAPWLLFSGGFGNFTEGVFSKTEAETFADIAIKKGVPKEAILIENKSTNTGQNVEFSKKLLEERGLDFKTFILVQKPYMERRTYATFKNFWPERDFIVTSQPVTFDEYPDKVYSKEAVISIMVGDLQRIKIYPERGFQIEQEIPLDVIKEARLDFIWPAKES